MDQPDPAAPRRLRAAACARHAAPGLPLAFAALPMYVLLPHHYATAFGAPLATLGLMLLAARGLDALIDPWLGRQVDRWFAQGTGAARRVMALAVLMLCLGFVALFFPPASVRAAGTSGVLVWGGLALLWTTTAYSTLAILHQTWGARLGGGDAQQSGLSAWREGAMLAGVLLASVLPALAGLAAAAVALAVMAAVAVPLAWRGPWPGTPGADRHHSAAPVHAAAVGDGSGAGRATPTTPDPAAEVVASPWADRRFRHLLTVFVLNGVAAAIPATLFPFFVRDRLQQPEQEPLLLGAYFLAAVLSLPVWVAVVRRIGLARSWALGMALAATAFCVTPWLEAGDARAFLLVCLASGLALGADLAVPAALLAAVVRDAGHHGVGEGRHFGWWQAATKMNLALAAGLALPLLDLAGYRPGARDPQALQALSLAYAALPCAVKLLALITWWPAWRRAPSLRPDVLEPTR